MTDSAGKSRWTLRRIQIAAIAVITVLFLARVFIPPLTRQARAEKLYLDAWYLNIYVFGRGDRDQDTARLMLKEALELSPGNSLYEQALVWKYPEKDLKALIQSGKLGRKTLVLASHRYYTYMDKKADSDVWEVARKKATKPSIYSPDAMQTPGFDERLYPPEYWLGKLDRLDKLAAIDPENALIRYRRAYVYSGMGRQSDMMAEVREANSMALTAIRLPEVSRDIENSLIGSGQEVVYADSPKLRELARRIVGYSNEQLRMRNAPAALRTSEDACRMGIRLASMEPSNYVDYLVAAAVFSIGRSKLDSICRDFGMTEKMKEYQSASVVFNNGVRRISRRVSKLAPASQPYSGMGTYMGFVTVSLVSLILFLAMWGITSLITRNLRRQKVDIAAWDQGWLLKMTLAVYLPMILVVALAGSVLKMTLAVYLPMILVVALAGSVWNKRVFPGLFEDYELTNGLFSANMTWIVIATQLVFAVILMVRLRKRYSISLGERISLLRFKFRIPIEARAWICRSYTLLFGAQMAFLLCLGMLASQLFISHYHACPWQLERLPFIDYSKEEAVTQRLADEMRKFAIEKGIIRSDNSAIGRASGR